MTEPTFPAKNASTTAVRSRSGLGRGRVSHPTGFDLDELYRLVGSKEAGLGANISGADTGKALALL